MSAHKTEKQSPARGGALQHRSELAVASWPVAPGGVLMGMREQRPEQFTICGLTTKLSRVQTNRRQNTTYNLIHR